MQPLRNYLIRLCVVLTGILYFYPSNPIHAQGGKNKPFTIVLDAGHGGHDAGAVGKTGKEKNINLAVALEVGNLLAQNCPDIKVVYTRKTDVFIPLDRRAEIANRNKADLFISIHTNALPKGKIARGAETYTLGMARAAANLEVAKRENSVITYEKGYQQTYEGFDPNKAESYIIFELLQDRYMKQSVELARYIQQQYSSAGRPNKGVHQAGFLVLRKTSMPAVLTELGFISTGDEESFLCSHQGTKQMAKCIYRGILSYRKAHHGISAGKWEDIPEKPSAEEEVPDRRTPATKEEKPDEPARKNIREETECQETKTAEDRPVFKIQLFVSDRKLKTNDRRFKGLAPVAYYTDDGCYKYTYGETTNYNEILRMQKSIKAKFPDTFVVAFINGTRTNLSEAIRTSRRQKQQ